MECSARPGAHISVSFGQACASGTGLPEWFPRGFGMTSPQDKNERTYGVNESVKGKYAECDGGGTQEIVMPNGSMGIMPSRETFKGVLTGLYFDQGDPPWRWYEMLITQDRPEGYPEETVWCEPGFIFLQEDDERDAGAFWKLMP